MTKFIPMKRIFTYITAVVLAGSLSSCLKDNSQPDFTQNKPVIELPVGSSAGNGAGNSIAASFTISETPSDYFVYVNYAAPEANASDVTVTLTVDAAALTKFNSVNGKDYTMIPSNGYSLVSNKITIPAGQRKVKFPIKINTLNLDPTKTYALPITITDGGGYTISGNFGTLISVIALKNKWDGVYSVSGTMLDKANSTLTGLYPRTLQFITQGPYTVAVFDPGSGVNAYGHGINSNGTTSYYGSFSPLFTIDMATNTITAGVNYYGQPSSNGRALKMDATGDNKFTMSADGKVPVSLNVKYIMVQDGTDRTFFDEVWKYTSGR